MLSYPVCDLFPEQQSPKSQRDELLCTRELSTEVRTAHTAADTSMLLTTAMRSDLKLRSEAKEASATRDKIGLFYFCLVDTFTCFLVRKTFN